MQSMSVLEQFKLVVASMQPSGGVQVRKAALLPNTKNVGWRTERKWAHRKMWHRHRVYRHRSKQVTCYEFIVVDRCIFVNGSLWDLIQKEVHPGS